MDLVELVKSDNILIQVEWGNKQIEFKTQAIERLENGVYVKPYMHNGQPVELNIGSHSGVRCNVYAHDPNTRKRIMWKNVELKTKEYENELVYALTTSNFNRLGIDDERRDYERIIIHREGELWDEIDSRYVQIMIHDISDAGLSFYAPSNFIPIGGNQRICFKDRVKNQEFDIEILCRIIRAEQTMGTMLFGCQVVEENKTYLMYSCLKRLMQNKPIKADETIVSEESNDDKEDGSYQQDLPENPKFNL